MMKLNDRHKELFALIKNEKFRLFVSMLFMLLVSLTTAATAYMIEHILDDIFLAKNQEKLYFITCAILIIYSIRGISIYGQEYLMSYVGQKIIRQLRNRLYDKIQDLPISFFHNERTGVLMSRITNDVNIVKHMISTAVTGALRDVFTIVFLIGVIFYQIWELAIYAFIVLPVAFYPIVLIGRKVRNVSTGCQEAMADLNSFLHETFAGNKIVKAFGMEGHEKERFFKRTYRLFKLEVKAVKASALSSPLMEFLGGLGVAFIVWYGGSRVIAGAYTAGTFISFLAAVLMLYEPVKKLSKLNNNVQQGLAAADRIFDILEVESDIAEKELPETIIDGPHNIVFDNVSFSYDTDPVLTDINLDVKPGEVLALVGMSGGGKSSLVNLIPRFYDVKKGLIKIDGIDIKDASITSLRKQIAVVSQEPILFNDSIRNNIAYGNKGASEEEIIEASKAAYAFDFINGLPDGFDTNIGELGSRLSGGEKQRICIARALIKNAPILILDEATSALDPEAEKVVQKALENLMKGRTTFVIAHRLSTIVNADRIAVIVGGRVVEEGKHDDLLSLGEEYFKLHSMQFKNA